MGICLIERMMMIQRQREDTRELSRDSNKEKEESLEEVYDNASNEIPPDDEIGKEKETLENKKKEEEMEQTLVESLMGLWYDPVTQINRGLARVERIPGATLQDKVKNVALGVTLGLCRNIPNATRIPSDNNL